MSLNFWQIKVERNFSFYMYYNIEPKYNICNIMAIIPNEEGEYRKKEGIMEHYKSKLEKNTEDVVIDFRWALDFLKR